MSKVKVKPKVSKGSKELTSYQVMTSILNPNVNPTEHEINKINEFFLGRYLSSDLRSINISNFHNRYYKVLPISVFYKISKSILSGKVSWINMPKKSATEDKAIINIARFYRITLEDAIEYANLMTIEKIKEFKTLYPEDSE